MRRCFDCRAAMPVDGTDTCLDCQEAHDEREYNEAYCSSEHDSACRCAQPTKYAEADAVALSVALARALVSVASLNEIAESECAA